MRATALGALLFAAAADAKLTCKGTPPATDAWCDTNCNSSPPNCPASMCTCSSGPSPPGPAPGPGPAPSPAGCSKCSSPNNCYHPTWAAPCSDAGSKAECEGSSSGAVWCGGAPAPPAPKGSPFAGAYLGLFAKDGLKRLQAVAAAADTLPLTRVWLAFASPTMVYKKGSNTLAGAGFGLATTAADAGFSDVKDAVTKLEKAGVEVFVSMGGWNYNCFPYLYARYSVGGYGTHTPNYWKVTQFGGGSLDGCTAANQFCYVCEPPSEHASLDLSFAIFPEPGNSSGWKKAQKFVEAGAGTPAPEWHTDMIPGHPFTDSKTGQTVKVPGSDAFAQQGRDPYADLVTLASDLGASGVDIDYEEFWHADYFKTGASTGPWELHQTVYKYAAVLKRTIDAISEIAPKTKLSTAAGAVGAWSGSWWGGNMKGVWLQVQQKYPSLMKFMSEGSNAGGVNVMTYDLSSNEEYHECPEDGVCSLDQQVNFYMNTYKTAGITANVGYEIGTPAYPDPTHDPSHQLPLTSSELTTLISEVQSGVGGGFFWEMYKTAGSGQATPTDVAQAICKAVLPGSKRCSGVIPQP